MTKKGWFKWLVVFLVLFLATGLAFGAKKKEVVKEVPYGEDWDKPRAFVDISKMADVSDFDPANYTPPTGDTIKIGYVNVFSGPAALNGPIHLTPIRFAAHDINKRGGIWVDGKKKLIEVIFADHQSKTDVCKKVCERLVLQDKVHVLMGTSGSHLMKIINEVGNKYKVISVNEGALSDELQDATNFGRYSFMPSPTTEQIGVGMAYYFGQIRKKEKKFYILCQDYSFGRDMAEAFKKGLKMYYPEAQIVGEDYHKLFLTDFAPYLTKIKASGAEVVYTGDWIPDAANLLKQARQMGITIPFANLFMDEPNFLHEIGVEGTKGLIHIDVYDMPYSFTNYPPSVSFYKAWNELWHKKWKTPPYNSRLFEHGSGAIGLYGQITYWLLSVIERAKSTDPEKIIKVWEGDVFRYANGKLVKMRACDHKTIQPLGVTEYVPPEEQKQSMTIPPYYWFQGTSSAGPMWLVPAAKILPSMDPKLDRCKGKNPWGN
ncbi:MAG: ABC transporter substrate-binding protein [Syntrophales bacterium]|nr:ABC transporter substrate-binding protein [Syntrophales bacterium]